MTNQKIRVMLVDDHAVVRSGLGAFLSINPDLELVGEAENGEQAIARCKQLKPDVILMDLMMPVLDGVTATQKIHKKYPKIRVIALTSFREDELVQRALEAGAIGYLMKNVSAVEIAGAIRSAFAGKMTLSSEAAETLLHAHSQSKEMISLTERERQVLKYMVDGLSNGEIGDRLMISLSTVKYHISNILMKLGVDNRVAAVAVSVQRKLV